ncbi:hypothetical protein A7K94_0200345 [Modestobacter sp. VKM Ac-2676]|nr:hypothetical protein A7K94_0200345 [Modestobacter sp. VKM Ac-2676]
MLLDGSASSTSAAATRQNLIDALRQHEPGYPGIFYYSGHADTSQAAASEDSLLLADGPLTAAEIWSSSRGEKPLIPFPARVALCACASSGAVGTGAGEWLGLGAAMMVAGARQVVATNWMVWDMPFTSRFDLTLAHLLQHASDSASALRELQLEYLAEWRDSDHSFTSASIKSWSSRVTSMPLPLIWGAYCCSDTPDAIHGS